MSGKSHKFDSISHKVEKGLDRTEKMLAFGEIVAGHNTPGPFLPYNMATTHLIKKMAPINNPMVKRILTVRSIGLAVAGLAVAGMEFKRHQEHKGSGGGH